MDLGLEQAGFRVLGCVEWDEAARRSLKANRGDSWPLLHPHDIRDLASTLRPEHLGLRRGDLSLLSGAPPCQPYSVAAQWSQGSRRGLLDERGTYLADYLRLLESFDPQVCVLENVPGFLKGETSAMAYLGSQLKRIQQRTGSSYRIEAKVLEASRFGVPQKRKRAIVLLLRGDTEFRWPAEL